MLDFERWKCFHKYISNHICSETIYKSNLIFFDNPTNKIIVHINMFGAEMILIISYEHNSGLVVREKNGSIKLGVKNLRNNFE